MTGLLIAGTLGLCPIDKEDVTWIAAGSGFYRPGQVLPPGYWMHKDGRVLAYDEATREWSHRELENDR